MQQNVALQVAEKVELFSTFRKVAWQAAECNISSATCNAIVSTESDNQSVSTGMVTTEILIIQWACCKLRTKIASCNIEQSSGIIIIFVIMLNVLLIYDEVF